MYNRLISEEDKIEKIMITLEKSYCLSYDIFIYCFHIYKHMFKANHWFLFIYIFSLEKNPWIYFTHTFRKFENKCTISLFKTRFLWIIFIRTINISKKYEFLFQKSVYIFEGDIKIHHCSDGDPTSNCSENPIKWVWLDT